MSEEEPELVFTKKLKFCRCFQILIDLVFFCIGFTALGTVILAKTTGIRDPRLTLGSACLESDTAGFVRVVILWGIFLGTAVLLTSILGIYSCLRKLSALLYLYSTLGYVLAIVELLFFLTLYIHLGRATQETEVCFRDVLVRSYHGPFKSNIFNETGAWDFLHLKYGCCGVDGGDVFNSMVTWDRTWIEIYFDPFFNTTVQLEEFKVITVLPYTCCRFKDQDQGNIEYDPDATVEDIRTKLVDENCPSEPTKENSFIEEGCFHLLNAFTGSMLEFAFVVSLFAEVLQLFAALCGLYSSRAIKNIKDRARMKMKRLILD